MSARPAVVTANRAGRPRPPRRSGTAALRGVCSDVIVADPGGSMRLPTTRATRRTGRPCRRYALSRALSDCLVDALHQPAEGSARASRPVRAGHPHRVIRCRDVAPGWRSVDPPTVATARRAERTLEDRLARARVPTSATVSRGEGCPPGQAASCERTYAGGGARHQAVAQRPAQGVPTADCRSGEVARWWASSIPPGSATITSEHTPSQGSCSRTRAGRRGAAARCRAPRWSERSLYETASSRLKAVRRHAQARVRETGCRARWPWRADEKAATLAACSRSERVDLSALLG